MQNGVSIALYGDSGSGKTTQIGEMAKRAFKLRGQRTTLFTADLGGYDSIGALIRAGIVTPVVLNPEKDDPWMWINDAVSGLNVPDGGMAAFDSGTSMSEALLTAAHKSTFQIGQQKTQKFTVSRGAGAGAQQLQVSINNEAHYGVVQGFMLDAIWRSMSLTLRGVDILWTFSIHRGEEQDRTPILGPKLAGKALTPAVPKWFNYTFRISSVPRENDTPVHRLYLTEYPDLAGLGHSFGNSRYPLGSSPLPPFIEPASVPGALDLIERGQKEADDALKLELGL